MLPATGAFALSFSYVFGPDLELLITRNRNWKIRECEYPPLTGPRVRLKCVP